MRGGAFGLAPPRPVAGDRAEPAHDFRVGRPPLHDTGFAGRDPGRRHHRGGDETRRESLYSATEDRKEHTTCLPAPASPETRFVDRPCPSLSDWVNLAGWSPVMHPRRPPRPSGRGRAAPSTESASSRRAR